MHDLAGRVAVVTGAAGGIGLELARQLAAAGMRVVMSDVDRERLEAAAAGVDGEVEAIAANVARPADVDALAARARARFGGVNVLCNNAGVTRPGPAWELGLDEWQWLLSVNVLGVVNGIRAFVPSMLERGEPGHIVNTASIGGLLPYAGIAAYTATKYAVVGLSESLHLDLRAVRAPIGVSVLCPGPTETEFRAHSRALHPDGPAEGVAGEYDGVVRIPAADAAAVVVEAIRFDRFWVITHPEYRNAIERRTRGIVDDGRGRRGRLPLDRLGLRLGHQREVAGDPSVALHGRADEERVCRRSALDSGDALDEAKTVRERGRHDDVTVLLFPTSDEKGFELSATADVLELRPAERRTHVNSVVGEACDRALDVSFVERAVIRVERRAHRRTSGRTSRPIRSALRSARSTPTARVPM